MLFWVQPPGAGEHGGGASCVDVVDHSVEWLGLRGVGPQQGREFLEQLLYLGREGGDGGAVSELQGLSKEFLLA